MITILIVEDDESTMLLTKTRLRNKYNILTAENGEKALEVLYENNVDLILSDLMMPVMDGYTLVKELKSNNVETPIILLTAKSNIEDKKKGFEYGADDYMTKPIDYEELHLRINALLRRTNITNKNQIIIGDAEVNAEDFSFKYKGENIDLTKKEFEILFKLISSPNKIFTKTALLEQIWGYDTYSLEDTVKTHINKLKTKVAIVEDFEILNMKGIGYKLVIKEGKSDEK